jgi:site-specific DNA recombinase
MTPRRTRPATAALYCRLSRRPDDGKVMTVAEQEKALRGEAERRGLSVIGTYADNGVSAYKRANRPGFADLLGALDGGGVGHVLVVALDRASRRVGDVAALRDALEDAGALLVADGREYDPRDDALSMYLTGIVGEQESRDKSRRVLAAKEQALSRGLYNGGRRPFGFEKPSGAARGFWVQQPMEAKAIRDGAKKVLAGKSLATVAEDWNRRGVDRPMTDGPWTASKVRRALLSPIVAGLRTHGGEIAGQLMRPDGSPWPAILTPTQRDDIDRALRSRFGRRPMRGWHTPNPGLLSGLVVCGVCGHNLTPRRYGGRRADAYTCQADGGGRCGGVGITLTTVDDLVTEAALHALDSPRIRKALAKPRKATALGEDPAEIQAELEELAAAAGRGEIPVREYLAARGPLDERLQRAVAVLDRDEDSTVLAPVLDADPRKAWERLDLDGRRGVLGGLLERVTVGPSNGHRGTFNPDRVDLTWRV